MKPANGCFLYFECSIALLWLRLGRMGVFYVLGVQMHYYGSDWVEWVFFMFWVFKCIIIAQTGQNECFLCFGCSDALLWLRLGRMGIFYVFGVQIHYYSSDWI